MKHTYYDEQEARIKDTAFGDSEDWQDLLARGSIGVIYYIGDEYNDDLWEWYSLDFPWLWAYVVESELEPITA